MPETVEIKKLPMGQRRRLLRTFRKQFGITLDELRKGTGLSKAMLSRFEAGNRNLSEKAWDRVFARVSSLTSKVDARRLAEIEKAKVAAEELGVLECDVSYEYLGRKYDERTRQESRDSIALAKSICADPKYPKFKADNPSEAAWIELEIVAHTAALHAMEAAEKVHRDYEPDQLRGVLRESDGSIVLIETTPPGKPNEFRETMALLVCERDPKTQKVLPWRPKKLAKPKPEPSGHQFEVCMAHNPQEEAALIAAGWQVVQSE